MAKTNEEKVVEVIANAVESTWFNPAVVGRMLAEQPNYTSDRIVEMLVHILRNQASQHEHMWKIGGDSSEGLFLASQLYIEANKLIKTYNWHNIKLPK